MENSSIFDRFTTNLKMAFQKASAYAVASGAGTIEPHHLLLGLLAQRGSLGAEILIKVGIKPDEGFRLFSITTGLEPSLSLSPLSQKAVERAALIAESYEHLYIGTEHLLAGLIKVALRDIEQMLQSTQGNTIALEQHLDVVLKSTSKFVELATHFQEDHSAPYKTTAPGTTTKQGGKNRTPALEYFARELTDPELQTTIDPVIGREQEIERVMQILLRRYKNNPLLLGDPGVGKTAIVEGLAKRIVEREVPSLLQDKRIYALDLGLIVAGTMYRGEFESRLKEILEETKEDPNIILFIDEIHMLIGAGSASGSMDAANLLKPALARGELRLIGATTPDEHKQHIETDPALERRMQAIIVHPPSEKETRDIIKGVKHNYERYHKVGITDESIDTAIQLSKRYMPEKFFPDKALDLIDEAASRVKLRNGINETSHTLRTLEDELDALRDLKKQKVGDEDFKGALEAKELEKNLLLELRRLKESLFVEDKEFVGSVGHTDVLEVVSQLMKLPLGAIEHKEATHYLNLEQKLKERIMGQDHALSLIAHALKRSRAGLSHENRPLGSFIFLGPSGVGKTETAKALARILFHDPSHIVRVDMSEFSESFTVSKLIGAPAGYVGYREENRFTDQVKKKPYSIVLLDEIEKAHPSIFNLLLQILEEGEIADATGRRINFRNTIIIMTSNIGLEAFNKNASIGFHEGIGKTSSNPEFEEAKRNAMTALKNRFRPEFLNRIDHVIVFNALEKKNLKDIVKLELNELSARLKEKSISIKYDSKTLDKVVERSFHTSQGARGIRHFLQEVVEANLADQILQGKLGTSKSKKMVTLSSLITP